ncbi:MAG: dihydroorotate dehydrogenase [Planctomycetaceae bacterium]
MDFEVPAMAGEWSFLGRKVGSPLGMPAGPLLNGKWILYYASLGFDVLTYKTVRSSYRECYPLPNLLPVRTGQLEGGERELEAAARMGGSWAVSFGMPSMQPDVWRRDIEWTRARLRSDQVLSVSVVGTAQPGWTIDELADDYALCARWAVESGADCIETNFSCPNVCSRDGQLYQEPTPAGIVAQRVREAIGTTPYILKIGHFTDRESASQLLKSVAPYVDGLAMTNSVAATVRDAAGNVLFDGQKRGICGDATRQASVTQVRMFAQIMEEWGRPLALIGVGGASTAEHVEEYLDAGAESVHIATAAMLDPLVGRRIRAALAGDCRS